MFVVTGENTTIDNLSRDKISLANVEGEMVRG